MYPNIEPLMKLIPIMKLIGNLLFVNYKIYFFFLNYFVSQSLKLEIMKNWKSMQNYSFKRGKHHF